jgi:hypothetical protein
MLKNSFSFLTHFPVNSATTLNLTFSIFTISELSDMRLGQFDHADFKSENRL